MIRWIRTTAVAGLVLSLIGLGIVIGLFLVANSGWVAVHLPPWLEGWLGGRKFDAWLPGLLAGWLVAIVAVVGLVLWSMYYVWRRRQSEAYIKRTERELAALRNLPLEHPTPIDDLDEFPDAELGRALDESSAGVGE